MGRPAYPWIASGSSSKGIGQAWSGRARELRVGEGLVKASHRLALPKTSACLFNSTNFDYLPRNMAINTVLCAGFLTDQCVEQTAKAGASRGYRMICLTDACAANTDERHRRALERLVPYGPPIECSVVLDLLARSEEHT